MSQFHKHPQCSACLARLFLRTYLTIWLIFVTIHEFHCIFGTIYKFYYIILANFYIYLQYFQQKKFSFNKKSKSQTDP